MLRHGNARTPGEVLRRERSFDAEDVRKIALGDDLAAARAGARPQVENVIGRADRVFIVLHDDHGISEIAQPPQRGDESIVIPLVKADAWFVEHVQAAGQAAADLRGQADALRFAPGKRAAFAIEREIAEPDLDEEVEPIGKLPPHFGGDELLLLVEHEAVEEFAGFASREATEFVDIQLAGEGASRPPAQIFGLGNRGLGHRPRSNGHTQHFRLEACAASRRCKSGGSCTGACAGG